MNVPGESTRSAFDARLRAVDAQIAAVELPDMPKPSGPAGVQSPALESLEAQVEQLCAQRSTNLREHHRWFNEAERAIRENDDALAKNALMRCSEHLQLAQEADALLTEFRALITEMQRSLAQSHPGQ